MIEIFTIFVLLAGCLLGAKWISMYSQRISYRRSSSPSRIDAELRQIALELRRERNKEKTIIRANQKYIEKSREELDETTRQIIENINRPTRKKPAPAPNNWYNPQPNNWQRPPDKKG